MIQYRCVYADSQCADRKGQNYAISFAALDGRAQWPGCIQPFFVGDLPCHGGGQFIFTEICSQYFDLFDADFGVFPDFFPQSSKARYGKSTISAISNCMFALEKSGNGTLPPA